MRLEKREGDLDCKHKCTTTKLIPGDIIIEINRELFTTIDNFLELIDTISKTGRNSLLLKIIRDEKSLWITIKFNQ